MKKKTWDWENEELLAISFYARPHGEGGALREQKIITCKKGGHMHGRILNMADKKARELGARSYRMWFCVPRAFNVDYPEEE